MEGRALVSQVVGVVAGVTLATIASAAASAPPAPAGYEAKVVRAMAIDDLTETGVWTPRGPETAVALDHRIVKVGERSLRFEIKVDFHNKSRSCLTIGCWHMPGVSQNMGLRGD